MTTQVQTGLIADSAITTPKLAAGAATLTKLDTTGASGKVLTAQGSGVAPAWNDLPAGAPTGALIASTTTPFATATTSGTGSTATITFTPAITIPVGSTVTISGVTPSGYNGTFIVTASSSGSISFASATTGSQTVAGSFLITPAGYLRCDGGIYSRASYPTLAGLVGTPFIASTPTVDYSNGSLVTPPSNTGYGVWSANNILFTNGTVSNPFSNASAASGAMLYSSNGTTWTAATSWNIGAWTGQTTDAVAYGNGVYVTVGGANSTTNVVQYSSSPGGTWTRAAIGIGYSNARQIVFGGTANVFIVDKYYECCGSWQFQGFYSSTNGSSWSAISGIGNNPQNMAAYSGGVVVNNQNYNNVNNIMYSATGTSGWTAIGASIGSPVWVYNVSYANGRFIARGTTGTWTSTTGAAGTWTQISTSTTGFTWGTKIRWTGAAYVDSANGRYSKDLINWGYMSTTPIVSGILNGRAYTRTATSISSYDFNAYNTTTQFPVPDIQAEVAGTGVMLEGGLLRSGYFIKT